MNQPDNKQLTRATDFCGVRSGRDVDKFKEARLTKEEAQVVDASDHRRKSGKISNVK